MYMTRDVSIHCFHTRFAHLSERKVLAEFCLFIDFIACHTYTFRCKNVFHNSLILDIFLLFVHIQRCTLWEGDAIGSVEGFQVNLVIADACLDGYDSS